MPGIGLCVLYGLFCIILITIYKTGTIYILIFIVRKPNGVRREGMVLSYLAQGSPNKKLQSQKSNLRPLILRHCTPEVQAE